jgi:hypothetical protein
MILSERLFFEDSEAVVELLEGLSGDNGAKARWCLALVGVDRLLDPFRFDVATKRAIASGRGRLLAQDAIIDKPLRMQLENKFRTGSPRRGATPRRGE